MCCNNTVIVTKGIELAMVGSTFIPSHLARSMEPSKNVRCAIKNFRGFRPTTCSAIYHRVKCFNTNKQYGKHKWGNTNERENYIDRGK